MKILIVNGPNLNLLGEREPDVYGADSLKDIEHWLVDEKPGHELRFFQSNHEGEILDALQSHRGWAQGFVVNPGGLTHTSVCLRDCIAACEVDTVEVHLSNIMHREPFRQHSYLHDVCLEQIMGRGKQGYLDAIEVLEKRG